ncbi:MAG: LacI family DNA-binding transcriptional regulator [Asticcacaulis sp.]
MPRLTIIDLAHRAGVSPKTISRVLNKEPGVKADKRELIERLIAETGFKPNPAARALQGSRSYMIGLIFERPVTHYYQHELQMGALSACRQAGYHLVIEGLAELRPQGMEYLKQRLITSRFDGVILPPPVGDDAEIIALFDEIGVPYVRVSPTTEIDNSYHVYIDDEQAAFDATEWLIGLGHQRLAYIENLKGSGSNQRRKAGFLRALSHHGLDASPDWIVRGNPEINNGFDEAEALLSLPDRPTAIFAAADYIAFGALAAAAKLRLSVPEDVSIIGFDNAPTASSVWPPLTSVHQPMNGLGEAATRLLVARLEGRDVPSAQQLDYHLVKRASAGAPPNMAPRI